MSEPAGADLLQHDEYEQWREGLIGPEQALRALCSDLGEVDSQLEPLQREREQLRAQIAEIVGSLGGKAEVLGFGELRITESVPTASYDRKELDALVVALSKGGQIELAEAIARCRVEGVRAGSLRIIRAKQ